MKNLMILIFILFSISGCYQLLASEESGMGNVVVSHGKYNDYYHIKYKLTTDNFSLTKNKNKLSIENGQFEIFLNKKSFPISAPNCKNKLILRMPATLSDNKNYNKSIQKKEQLFSEIKKIKDKKISSLNIVIELNPYVKVKSKNPLILELENCNIFFRTKNNNYINTLY